MLGTNTLVLGAVFLLKDRLASCHFKEQRVLSCKPFTILLKRFPFVGRKKIPVWGSLLFLFNVRHLADPIGDGHLELSVCWMAWKERGPVREGLTGDCHWKSVLPEAAVGGGGGGGAALYAASRHSCGDFCVKDKETSGERVNHHYWFGRLKHGRWHSWAR